MKNLILGLCIVLCLILSFVSPAAAQAPTPPTAGARQIAHFGEPHALQVGTPSAPVVQDWAQSNVSGFGTTSNYAVSALETFSGQLYAGTTNDNGAEIWRTSDGNNWTQASLAGFGIPTPRENSIIFDLIVYNGMLYAGTGHWVGDTVPGQIWRSSNGTTWEQVTGGWEVNTHNEGVVNFGAFGAMLYAATFNPVDGFEIWRSGTGNSNDWHRVVGNAFGAGASFWQVTGLTTFNNYLYAAMEGQQGGTGTQVWRTADGAQWSPVNTNGFNTPANYQTGGWGIFQGNLYLGTRNDATGGQLWRSSDGANWLPVVTNGFGSVDNYKVEGMVIYGKYVFAFTDNSVTGAEVWRSADGVSWQQVNADGFGSSSNFGVAVWSNGAALLNHMLYVSTWNANGGQVWEYLLNLTLPPRLYLPVLAR